MSNLEILKQELIAQKSAIEARGGIVTVANLNPSPSEITAGIKTIESPDLTASTATAEDVIKGKTFYSGDLGLKTGSFDLHEYTYGIFLFDEASANVSNKIYFSLAEGQTKLRSYAFRGSKNSVEFTFNSDIQEIGEYAFYLCPNFEFPNFSSLTNLTSVGANSFCGTSKMSANLSNMPSNLQDIGQKAFGDVLQEGDSLIIPDSVSTIGTYAFARTDAICMLETFKFPSTFSSPLPAYALQFLSFNCDLRLPDTSTTVNNGFNNRGSFNNITIPASYTTLKDMCFGSSASDPVSNFHLRTVTFEGANPPTIGRNIFATQHVTNGFKIYVPDEAVDEYKAITNLANYVSCIYPVSEKE